MLTITDWIAVASIALPLIIKALSDFQANAVANHNALLARISGMAGREAATIARTLTNLPADANAKTVESNLIYDSATSILREMGASSLTIGADSTKLATIVQGELNKLIVPPATPGK